MAQKIPNIHYLVTESYLMTRNAALHFPVKQFRPLLKGEDTVYGMVIDMPLNPQTVVTLVAYVNGAANLYYNNGASYTGASQRYQSLVQATRILVISGNRILQEAKPTKQTSMPMGQPFNFFLLTTKGIYEKQVDTSKILEESKEMQTTYFLYQQVMREIHSAQLKDRSVVKAKGEQK